MELRCIFKLVPQEELTAVQMCFQYSAACTKGAMNNKYWLPYSSRYQFEVQPIFDLDQNANICSFLLFKGIKALFLPHGSRENKLDQKKNSPSFPSYRFVDI